MANQTRPDSTLSLIFPPRIFAPVLDAFTTEPGSHIVLAAASQLVTPRRFARRVREPVRVHVAGGSSASLDLMRPADSSEASRLDLNSDTVMASA